jgi:hypothetical protein
LGKQLGLLVALFPKIRLNLVKIDSQLKKVSRSSAAISAAVGVVVDRRIDLHDALAAQSGGGFNHRISSSMAWRN